MEVDIALKLYQLLDAAVAAENMGNADRDWPKHRDNTMDKVRELLDNYAVQQPDAVPPVTASLLPLMVHLGGADAHDHATWMDRLTTAYTALAFGLDAVGVSRVRGNGHDHSPE